MYIHEELCLLKFVLVCYSTYLGDVSQWCLLNYINDYYLTKCPDIRLRQDMIMLDNHM